MRLRSRRGWFAALAMLLAVGACAAPFTSPGPPSTPSPEPRSSSEPAPNVDPSPETPTPADGPLTWFAPMPYAPAGRTDAIDGSADYDGLFDGTGQWSSAARETDIVKLYSGWVEWHATDAQLRAIVRATRDRGQRLALEIGPLVGSDVCGMDVEGFNATLTPVRRIHAAGGSVDLVAFDEPYAFGRWYAGPRACAWPVERIAEQTAAFVRELRSLEPGILVGDIEPLWQEITPDGLGAWADAYERASGAPFDFLHLDVDWASGDWAAWVAAAAGEMSARTIPLGVIYNGGEETSDEAWTDAARAHIDGVEAALGGPPDEVIFQSWMHYPRHALPDTDPTSLSGLLRQYATAARTVLEADAPNGGTLTGRVTTTGGSPVPGARVSAVATMLDGGITELELAGTVPDGAERALVGVRVNAEYPGTGESRFAIYGFRFTEGDASANLVPDADFTIGGGRWGWEGDASVRLVTSDLGEGRMLEIEATAAQHLILNGAEFPVTPGLPWRLQAKVRAPEPGGSVPQVIVVFLHDAEIGRSSLPVVARVSLPPAVADASGVFRMQVPDGRLRVDLLYGGDAGHWRSTREVTTPTGACSPGRCIGRATAETISPSRGRSVPG